MMEGRLIYSVNFFHLEDAGKILDAELSNQWLDEFPPWLIEAKKQVFALVLVKVRLVERMQAFF